MPFYRHSKIPGTIDTLGKDTLSAWKCADIPTGSYIHIPYNNGIPTPFTTWTWIKCSTQSNEGGTIIGKSSYWAAGTNDFPFSIVLLNTNIVAVYVDSGGNWDADLTVSSDSALTQQTWHFIATRWSGSALTLFTDDVQKTGNGTISIVQSTFYWRIGMPPQEYAGGVGQRRYAGKIWGFGLYNSLKTDSEINAIKKGYIDSNNALVLYNMIDSSTRILTDYSGNKRDGFLVGDTSWYSDSPWAYG